MGVFRLLLALAVVLQHTGAIGGFQPIDGVRAVESFFMISGFYMALILTEKYRGPGSHRLFLGNRFLRIYPMYWVVAAATVLFWLGLYALRHNGGALQMIRLFRAPGAGFVTLSNLLIFGQDVVMFTGTNADGRLFFTTDFHRGDVAVYAALWVPPAWTLAVELTFYLVAPLLVRRSARVLAAGVAASLALRAWLFFGLGLRDDPWTYRFFPTEIAYFLAGALAYRAYRWLQPRAVPRPVLWGGAGTVFALYFLYQFLPPLAVGDVPLTPWIFCAAAWVAIPALFLLTKDSRVDRYVGELSYPLYLVHWLVMSCVLRRLWTRLDFTPGEKLAIVIGSLLAALALVHLVSEPVERLRRWRTRRLETAAAAPAFREGIERRSIG